MACHGRGHGKRWGKDDGKCDGLDVRAIFIIFHLILVYFQWEIVEKREVEGQKWRDVGNLPTSYGHFSGEK